MYNLILGDCLKEMQNIPDGSVDMILCDPPYGTTACKWDSIIPFEPMWEQLNRIVKEDGAVCFFGAQPFTSALICSNIKKFKHHWIWKKNRGTGFQVAKYRPMMATEDVIVFSVGKKKSIIIRRCRNLKSRIFAETQVLLMEQTRWHILTMAGNG